jgi:intracellular septation protein
MKFLFDVFPVILFFIAFKVYDIYVATAVAIGATFGQIGWLALRGRKIDNMLWVSLAVITVFGGATLALADETFIKWKPTVLYWLFAAVLAAASLGFRKNLVRAMMEKQVTLPDEVWARLLTSWIVFFAVMGVLNIWVAYTFSTDAWVNFKLFGGIGLMIVFVLGQALRGRPHTREACRARSRIRFDRRRIGTARRPRRRERRRRTLPRGGGLAALRGAAAPGAPSHGVRSTGAAHAQGDPRARADRICPWRNLNASMTRNDR